MKELKKQLQSALIVEQQSLAQSHIKYSLQHLGFEKIDFVDRAHLAIDALQKRQYQLVLCAYELNKGADGYQLFERMHKESLLPCSTAFVFMSSENDIQLTQSIIELNPDDFLLKPFTSKELESRLRRVLTKKIALKPIFDFIGEKKFDQALVKLNDYISQNDNPKWMPYLMKLKGEILFEKKDWSAIEQFYQSVLRVKVFSWAQLGLVECYINKNKYAKAQFMLSDLINNPSTRLHALELLVKLCEENEDYNDALQHLKKAAELAPRNIGRQRHLNDIARLTSDFECQYLANNNIVRNVKHSVHETPEVYLNAVRANIDYGLTSFNEQEVQRLAQQSQHILDGLKKKFPKVPLSEKIDIATARIHHLKNEPDLAKKILTEQMEAQPEYFVDDLEDALDLAKALHELGFHKDSQKIFEEIAVEAKTNANLLFSKFIGTEKQLREDVKQSPKELNNNAVGFYSRGKLKEALDAFKTAFRVMPKNPAIALNVMQTIAESQFLDLNLKETKDLLARCEIAISEAVLSDEQGERLLKIKKMLLEERI